MPKFSDKVFQTFGEIIEGIISRAPEITSQPAEAKHLVITDEGLRSIRAVHTAEVMGAPGPPGPPGRTATVFEQEREPTEARTGDYWISP